VKPGETSGASARRHSRPQLTPALLTPALLVLLTLALARVPGIILDAAWHAAAELGMWRVPSTLLEQEQLVGNSSRLVLV
jgi:hypothetical protein